MVHICCSPFPLLGCGFRLDKCIFRFPLAQLLLVSLLLVQILNTFEVLEEGVEVNPALILHGEFLGWFRWQLSTAAPVHGNALQSVLKKSERLSLWQEH